MSVALPVGRRLVPPFSLPFIGLSGTAEWTVRWGLVEEGAAVAGELVGSFAPQARGHVCIAYLGGHSVESGVSIDAVWVHT